MFKALGYLSLIVIGVLLRAWVLATLWGWFLVAHFAIKPITMPVAYGLSVIVAMFRHDLTENRDKDKSEADKAAMAIGRTILVPLVALGLGAVATVWMP